MTILIDDELTLGAPERCGPMTLFPLLRTRPPVARAYVSGPETAGEVVIRERGLAEVAELVVENRGDRPVLLIEGETVLGAKQDRVLNVSVVLAAGGRTKLPVSCIEAGRWGSPKASRRSARHTPPRLRARKTRSVVESARHSLEHRSDQGAVWDEVAAYEAGAAMHSPTSAMREVQEAMAGRSSALVPTAGPADEQVGVIVAEGGRPTLLELFDDPATFEAYWVGLTEGYALDAALRGGRDDTTVEAAEAFLDAARLAPFESQPGLSLGETVQAASPDLTAVGVSWGGEVVHLVCFATAA